MYIVVKKLTIYNFIALEKNRLLIIVLIILKSRNYLVLLCISVYRLQGKVT